MISVDSSGWIEYLTNGELAEYYARKLDQPEKIVTPTIVLYEVFKRLKRELGEEIGLLAVAQVRKTRVEPVSEEIALTAADLSLQYGLAMADSMILATARIFGAHLFTSDADFAEIPGVTYLAKPKVK